MKVIKKTDDGNLGAYGGKIDASGEFGNCMFMCTDNYSTHIVVSILLDRLDTKRVENILTHEMELWQNIKQYKTKQNDG